MATTLIKRSLEQHEEIIESGVKSFIDVGNSLAAIRDNKLYPEEHKTFEAYCKSRWGFAKAHAYRLIESAVVVSDLSPNGGQNGQLPANERQARALAESAPDAKTRAVVWKAAVESAPKGADGKPNVTAAVVNKAAAAIVGEKPQPPKSTATAAKNGKATVVAPKYDKQAIEKSYGSLVRLVDDMARVSNMNNSPHHRQCTSLMSSSLDEFRKLAKECDAVHARK
jgi:hypothetical protein